MADETDNFDSMPVTVPLGKCLRGIPRRKRAARAIKEIREHVGRAMKVPTTGVRIWDDVNEAVWARGNQNPPMRLHVVATRIDDDFVEVRLQEGPGDAEQ